MFTVTRPFLLPLSITRTFSHVGLPVRGADACALTAGAAGDGACATARFTTVRSSAASCAAARTRPPRASAAAAIAAATIHALLLMRSPHSIQIWIFSPSSPSMSMICVGPSFLSWSQKLSAS